MSDAPPTKKALDCLICGFNAKSNGGQQWHYDAINPGAARGHTMDRRALAGKERRRRPLLSNRMAAAMLGAAGGSVGPSEVPGAPGVGPPSLPGAPNEPAPSGAPDATGRTAGGQRGAGCGRTSPDVPSCAGADAPRPAPLPESGDAAEVEAAVQAELDGLLKLARVSSVNPPPSDTSKRRSRKKRRKDEVTPDPPAELNFEYVTLHTKAMFEELKDWNRCALLAVKRKLAKEGKFNTIRLRAPAKVVRNKCGCGVAVLTPR